MVFGPKERKKEFLFADCTHLTFCTNTEKNAEDRWVSLKWFGQEYLEKSEAATTAFFPNKFLSAPF